MVIRADGQLNAQSWTSPRSALNGRAGSPHLLGWHAPGERIAVIQFEQVSKRYKSSGSDALTSVDLTIEDGEFAF